MPTTASDLFVTRISTSDDVIEQLVPFLNIQLANATTAQLQIKFAHWNVKGEGFFPAHKLFDEIYELVQEQTDDIGERITALGGVAEGLPEQVAKATDLPEYGSGPKELVQTHMESMADLVGFLSNEYRTGIALSGKLGDLVTQDLFLKMAGELDRKLYFLEAHLRP